VKQQGGAYRFLGLNASDTATGARAFVAHFGWTWPSIADPRRTLAHRFGIDYQPAVVLIDAKGRFVAKFEGAGTAAGWNALKRRLRTS